MKKINGESLNIEEMNIKKLKQLFPESVIEGQINLEVLAELIGQYADTEDERYDFTWNGKKDAMRISQSPTKGTLRPDKENSKDWNYTDNIYLEGDNLEILKILQKSYRGKIKMIYIDPPYNTGKDFVYKDNYKDNINNYLKYTEQIDGEGKKISTNTESSGRYHTNWLNMMYPRLRLAKNLLSNDGAIFISIDDNEVHNLRKICDEIFGEENFRNKLAVRRRVKSLNNQFADRGLKSLNVGLEYILVYSKSDNFLMEAILEEKKEVQTKGRWNVFWSNADRPTMRYNLLGFAPKTGQWRWSEEKALEAVDNYKKYIEKYSNEMSLEEYWKKTNRELRFIRRIENGVGKNGGVQYWVGPNNYMLRTSNWLDIEVSEIRKDFDLYFSNPKSLKLIKTLLTLSKDKNSIVLDFFAGSSTTAHAVMELNAKDGGSRRHIMVQLPEETEKDSEARRSGYRTISDIGRERIRKAGEKIKKDYKDKNGIEDLDTGFKAFKLDNSNIKEWNPDYEDEDLNFESLVDNFIEGRKQEDILYEIILKYGLDLSINIEKNKINKKIIYSLDFGKIYVCLEDEIDEEVINKIVDLNKNNDIEALRVIFKDIGFKDDETKLNAKLTLENNGIKEVLSI